MFDFSGRTALITGAGQGMGAGIAQALASRGAHVFINDLFEDRANAAAKSISSTGHKATPLAGDITDTDFRAAMQTQIEAKGTLDILVNNAGVPTDMAGSFAGEIAAKATAIGRAGSPEDAAAAAIYLCSSEASWMTGQTIALNGGASTA